jgi:hypothetical protein
MSKKLSLTRNHFSPDVVKFTFIRSFRTSLRRTVGVSRLCAHAIVTQSRVVQRV